MLLEFSVTNFKAIAEKQTFSMVASASAGKRPEHSFETGNSFAPHALRSACLFGANGSGKSSFIEAMDFFESFILTSAKDRTEGEEIDVKPFKLDKEFLKQPSEFEATFLHEGALYQYGFAVTRERVVSEWMYRRSNIPRSQMTTLFQREFNAESQKYEWQTNPAFGKRDSEFFKSKTRDNALFLSSSILFNFDTLKPAHHWIQRSLHILSTGHVGSGFTSSQVLKEHAKEKILNFIQKADIKITNLKVVEEDFKLPEELLDLPDEKLEQLKELTKSMKNYNVKTIHKDRDGDDVEFELDDESDGTQKLYAFAGPIMDVLDNGDCLIVDELNSSLHPLAMKYIIGLFNNPETNKKNAQLIFTTHDTSILNKNFMHKDQVWFIEKDEHQAAHLYPLTDFKVRDTETLEKAYLDGRFGAVPFIKRF